MSHGCYLIGPGRNLFLENENTVIILSYIIHLLWKHIVRITQLLHCYYSDHYLSSVPTKQLLSQALSEQVYFTAPLSSTSGL